MEVRSPYSGLHPRKRDPKKRETRTCERDGCENTFDVYVSSERKYCTSECRFADPQLRDRISESNTTHKLSDLNESRMTATCSICGPKMKIVKGSRARSDGRPRYSCWLAGKAWHWEKHYGVTAVYVALLLNEQDGKCGICAKKLDESFCVDHDHDTGRVRGLLCHNCNKGLGLLGDTVDSVEAALKYLKVGAGQDASPTIL